ncbi:MAG: methyltransferase domain-containing protein [Sedimenticolaceae bacterium]
MCNACLPTPSNVAATEAFAEQMLGTLNQGALSLMISIGHRTGLFDALAELPPADSAGIAAQAGLNERYVREWLGAMVTGGIIEYDAATDHYRLPAFRAALLTRAATPDNFAVFAQYIGLLGQVEDRVIDCFRNGGGVAYEHFPRFQEIMAEDSGQTVLGALDQHILPLVPGLIDRLEQGIRVLDVGCGRGHALLHLSERFPRSQFTGYDLSDQALAQARARAAARGLRNLIFECRDLTGFADSADAGAFDLITAFDAIHDQAAPQDVLKGIHRSLEPAGTFLMQDIRASSHLQNNLDHPIAPLLYTLSTMHCMTVSLAQGGAGLGTMWGEELARQMLRDAGFDEVEVHQLAHDVQNNFYVMSKPQHQSYAH